MSFGGNAVTAAFCCAKLGIKPDLIATNADDWLGNMFHDMAAKYDVHLHTRKVEKSSLSFIMPRDGKRAIVRCRDDHYLTSFPVLELDGCRALHLDGHQADAALFYAQRCRKAGILTSLDGGGLRTNTHELLAFIDVAMVAERFCQQMDKTPAAMLDYLKSRGCKIGGVTQGERGVLWYDESGTVRTLPALAVPAARVRDTSGAGDVFHGAYVYSYLDNPFKGWEQHFGLASTPRPTRSSISATKRACRHSTRSTRSPANSIRMPASSHGRREKISRRCAPAADRTRVPPAEPASAAASSDVRPPCPAR